MTIKLYELLNYNLQFYESHLSLALPTLPVVPPPKGIIFAKFIIYLVLLSLTINVEQVTDLKFMFKKVDRTLFEIVGHTMCHRDRT